jgi:hypothetical protein
MATADDSLKLASLYEAELLVELMLRYWRHPHRDDADYRNALLESAVGVLKASAEGTQFIDMVPPKAMNLVAAVWYVEWNALDEPAVTDPSVRDERLEWVTAVRRSIPACFCDPQDLDGFQ